MLPSLAVRLVPRGRSKTPLYVFVKPPSITPGVGAGGMNRCEPGQWQHFPTSYTYAWRVVVGDHFAGLLGTSQTLKLTTADEGDVIECTVTASNAAGPSKQRPVSNHYAVPSTAPVATSNPVVTMSTQIPDRQAVEVTPATHATLAGYGPNEWSYYTTIAEKVFLSCDPGLWNRSDLTFSTSWSVSGQATDIEGDKRGNDYIAISDPFDFSKTFATDQLRFNFTPGNVQEPTVFNGTVTCTITATTPQGRQSTASSLALRIWNGCDVGLEPWDQKILYSGPLCEDYTNYYGGP